MKKLLFIFTLICAFSINASAQEQKVTSQDLAKKDAVELTQLLSLNDTQTNDFFRLFEMKYTILEDKTLSDERKSVLSQTIEAKIRASLDAKQISILEANPDLLKRLK
ncbi:hypothetical protein [Flavobacterium sp.]|uniref:hypothetical protein n=1 Tax=Flavobacterium sp. TaxID=239 RepID=UPI0037523FC5